MFSPKLYVVRKINSSEIINSDYNLIFTKEQTSFHKINQQDNMLFRQVRLITKSNNLYNKHVIFVDCTRIKKNKEAITKLVSDGFMLDGVPFVLSEKSASMSRNSILGFVSKFVSEKLYKSITMGIIIDKTVISKYLAYRGLMLSSCFCIEEWLPKIIVVDDYSKIIKNQKVRYAVDSENTYTDEETNEIKKFINKDITDGEFDIKIDPFDGCGLHHPLITQYVSESLNIKDESPTSIMWRFPFVKGVTHDFDYVQFFKEYGISHIKDIWGEIHSVLEDAEPMIILTKSMYKGYKYFKNKNTIDDWKFYWEMFRKYNHCIGIAKWNYGSQNEPQYTRASYQILQDIEIDYDDFVELSDYSLEWTSKIIDGDDLYTNCFLGLFATKFKASNDYMKAILKNPVMKKDPCVRKYLINMIKKYIDEFKCGKLFLNATFRILAPDLIMLAEFIGGIETPIGVLSSNEFYCDTVYGNCEGEYLIERNPHICASEHVVLKGVKNEILNKYCGHLQGVAMVNANSIVLQRLNGADLDGVKYDYK